MGNRKKRIRKLIYQNRSFGISKKMPILLFTLLFSSLMILGSTYAWFTSEDTKKNEFVGGRLAAEIVEEFEANYQWQPAMTTVKKISVENTGDIPAFVRLSLYEYLLLFKVDTTDQTGNGNLVRNQVAKDPVVDGNKIETWQKAAEKGGTYESENTFFLAKKAVIPKLDEPYIYQDSERDRSLFKWFQLEFREPIYTSLPPPGTKKYWLYQEGYFYYSELLEPKETSEYLLKNVHLSQSAPNSYKGVLYQLNPTMDAHDATSLLFSAWKIPKDSQAYQLFFEKIQK